MVAGCSSSSVLIPSIFLINVWYDDSPPVFESSQVNPSFARVLTTTAGNAQLETRVGFFGICMNADGGSWIRSAPIKLTVVANKNDFGLSTGS